MDIICKNSKDTLRVTFSNGLFSFQKKKNNGYWISLNLFKTKTEAIEAFAQEVK